MTHSLVVAIDGPSGGGKSSVAKDVAEKLNILYVDTGAMFRALGAHFQGCTSEEINEQMNQTQFEYGERLLVNGKDVTDSIRGPKASELASKISKLPKVREYLLKIQREIGEKRPCIMEGRDIGTVVFPRAFLKIFLTASIEERGKRRFHQLKEKGYDGTIEDVISDIRNRDDRDTQREEAPLKKDAAAIEVDTTSMTQEEVVNKISDLAQQAASNTGINIL